MKGTRVEVQNGESLDRAIRRFKKVVQEAGIMAEIKKHTYYDKPSEIKRAKAREWELEKRRAKSKHS